MTTRTPEEIEKDNFLREVDEEVAREKWHKFVKKYGIYFAFAAFLALAVTAGYEFYSNLRRNRIYQESSLFNQATIQMENDKELAVTTFSKLRQTGKTDYAILASFSLASIYYEQGKPEMAEALLKALAEDKKVAPPFRRLAAVSLVYHQKDNDFTEKTLEQIVKVEKDAGAYRPMLTELKALLAYRNKDKAKALGFYKDLLNDPETPESIQIRAKEIVDFLNE